MDRLETFQKAKDEKAKAIHIEVWMTVDQKLIVLKCGSNGEFEESVDGKKEIIYVESQKGSLLDICEPKCQDQSIIGQKENPELNQYGQKLDLRQFVFSAGSMQRKHLELEQSVEDSIETSTVQPLPIQLNKDKPVLDPKLGAVKEVNPE